MFQYAFPTPSPGLPMFRTMSIVNEIVIFYRYGSFLKKKLQETDKFFKILYAWISRILKHDFIQRKLYFKIRLKKIIKRKTTEIVL